MEEKTSSATQERFETTINEHGYSFQQSILRLAEKLALENKSGWMLQACEVPVEVRGRGTRIDIVLQRFRRTIGSLNVHEERATYMIAECKRANPAYSDWCFAKFPYRLRDQYESAEALIFEQMRVRSEPFQGSDLELAEQGLTNAVSTHQRIHRPTDNIFHIAIETKTDKRGNKVSGDTGKDAVENAASQVCQGLNGMVHFLARNVALWEKLQPVSLVPVIFTTANLWASDADLSAADISTGDLSFDNHTLKQVPWLYFQYNLSPGIKHSIPPKPFNADGFSDLLQAEYIRTIAVVNATGIEEFLRQSTAWDFRS